MRRITGQAIITSIKAQRVAAELPRAWARRIHLENRTELFDNQEMKGSEFLRRVKSIAKRHRLTYRWNPERGAGSHGTLYLGNRFTVVKDLKKAGPGLLADMCKQLGVQKEDL